MAVNKRGLRRLAVLFGIATVGVLAVGAQAASANVIEICKSSANGMSGRSFQYSVTGAANTITVNGGRCSGPINVGALTQTTITEGASNPGTDVASTTVRPSIRKVSEDLANRSVTVTTGATTSSETLVTFTNQPAGGNSGTLKVCKLTQTPAYLGRLFSFSVNGGPLVSTEANDAFDNPANWSCRILGTFPVGSNVVVHEAIPSGTEVQFIDSDPATALVDFNTSSGNGTYNIQAGVTVALFDDEPIPPSGTGTLEICKTAADLGHGYADPDVHGPFTFTVTDSALANYGPFTINVPSPNYGQVYCTAPFTVAAGIATVTEGPSPGFDLVDVFTNPEDRLLTANLINRTADVEVPSSTDPNDETQVVFVNQTQRAQLKLCKTLGPGSSDLIGQKFAIDWTSDSGAYGTTWITAQATTQCVIVGNLPIGATVSLSEQNPGEFIDVSGPSSITLAPGINTATFTNTARGLLEICKHAIADLNRTTTQPTFQFRVDGGGLINVRAGTCTPPMRVSVGAHTVSEVSSPNYELDPGSPAAVLLGFDTNGGIVVSPADREISRQLSSRSVTVNVPYGPNGETLVTFFNRVRQGQIKICKAITPGSVDSLGGKTFTYHVYVNGRTFTVGPIAPGECQFVTDSFGNPRNFPILDANLKPVTVGALEDNATDATPTLGTFYVSRLALTGGTNPQTNCQPALYSPTGQHCKTFLATLTGFGTQQRVHIAWTLGPSVNAVTFTNTAGDP
jgi:hypothetical protein